MYIYIFFFNDTATTEIYTLSLHDALPIWFEEKLWAAADKMRSYMDPAEYKHVVLGLIFLKYISDAFEEKHEQRSEEHTSELQSRQYLVCRLLLEKKKKNKQN